MECATLELACRCGITACNARLQPVAGHDVLMVERFGMAAEAARKEIERIVAIVRTWREHFRACGVSEKDIEYMAQAFLPDCFFFEKPADVLN